MTEPTVAPATTTSTEPEFKPYEVPAAGDQPADAEADDAVPAEPDNTTPDDTTRDRRRPRLQLRNRAWRRPAA